MSTSESWQLFVHNGRHNHKVVVYNHAHTQIARLTEEQLHQIEQFRRVMCRLAIYYDFSENKTLAVQSERGYTVFHRNCEESNVLSDIVVAHPTSIAMIRTWPYVLIMDTTYKTNKYNISLLEAVGMTLTGKNFTVAIIFMCNEQATTYRWVLQQIKHIDHNVLVKLTEMVKDEEVAQRFVNSSWKKLINEIDKIEYQRKLEVLKTRWKSRPDFLHVLHFGVETTNRAESEHSMLKVWLSMCHGDLDTVFLNIDSLIQGQIAEIKYTLKISKLKEKYGAKSNAILKNLSNKLIPIREEDVDIFWRRLEISSDIPKQHDRDMDSEMSDLTSLIHEISMGLISKGRRKTNSTKRDKSHWESVSVAHRKIGKSSGSGSGSRSGSGSGYGPSPHGRGRSPRSGRGRGRGRNSGRSSLSSVVNPDAHQRHSPSTMHFPGDENYSVEIRRRMFFDLHHHMNVYVQLFRSVERVTELIRRTNWEEGSTLADYWMDTPDHLYVIANTFNLCVVFLARLGSTTVLPLVSNMDDNAGTIFIGFIEEQQHFIQLHLRDGCLCLHYRCNRNIIETYELVSGQSHTATGCLIGLRDTI
ncbi:hypothetical protein M9H77_22556 [Catharanthus roseus]|uniref:Uncharacterized protein n=1 Tax=Catharanthus roseus TaxID=4058 RepID=A0ACC0AUW3_CATRO|nr:hypothetical protein M9H77_22556 [Catharanthus roseus]